MSMVPAAVSRGKWIVTSYYVSPMSATGTGFETIDEHFIGLDGQLRRTGRAIRPRCALHPDELSVKIPGF
jgi:hypothetical protein